MNTQKFTLNENVIFGNGVRNQLPEEIKNRGFKKVLVVTDKVLFDSGVSLKVTDCLDENRIEYVVYSDVKPNPPIENVLEGTKMCQMVWKFLLQRLNPRSKRDKMK